MRPNHSLNHNISLVPLALTPNTFSFLLRRSVVDWSPWLAVLLLILINEAGDLWIEQWPSPAMQYGESAKDIILTMVPPTLMLLTARRLPWLYAPRRRQDGSTPG
jgi:hypothetical protein